MAFPTPTLPRGWPCRRGQEGLVLVVRRRRRGGGCGRGGAGTQEGPRRAEGARVHGQEAHQPHAALRRREAKLHLPWVHSIGGLLD
jgi:hypothetical protein